MEGGVTFTLGGRFIYGERRGKLFGKVLVAGGKKNWTAPDRQLLNLSRPPHFASPKCYCY